MQNETYRRRCFQIRDEIVEHYDRIVQDLIDGYAVIARVRVELDKAPPDRDVREIQDRLRDIAVVTRATLIDLGEQPRSARALAWPMPPRRRWCALPAVAWAWPRRLRCRSWSYARSG